MTTDGFLEDGTLLVAMNGAAVSDMPPVFDVDTAVVTEDSSLTGLRRLKREGPGHEVALLQFLPYNL